MQRARALSRWSALGLALLASGFSACASAEDRSASERVARHAEIWMAVGDTLLDDLRGGFDPGNGLMVTFGISRATYVNGDLVAQTTLNFGQLNNLSAGQAAQLSKQMAALNLIQIGPGNNFAPQQVGTSGTVIQNTLDNQHIVNQTVIDASGNALGMIKNLNTQAPVTDGVVRAITGPR